MKSARFFSKMIKEIIYKIILVSGLAPASILLCFSFYGIFKLLSDQLYSTQVFLDLFAMILGIFGFVGLVRALMLKNKPTLTILLLILGLVGISMIGGVDFWIWTFTMAEPDEWIIAGYPMIVSIIAIVVNSYEFLNRRLNS